LVRSGVGGSGGSKNADTVVDRFGLLTTLPAGVDWFDFDQIPLSADNPGLFRLGETVIVVLILGLRSGVRLELTLLPSAALPGLRENDE
jgi:hypothetical protein